MSLSKEISQLRAHLSHQTNDSISDSDCRRFLFARNCNIEKAADMIKAWYTWRHTLMAPLPPRDLRFSPNYLLTNPDVIDRHPAFHLLTATHWGFNKEGCPIYWEKTGEISSNFSEVIKHFSVDFLVQAHISSQELMSCRLKHASKLFNKEITKSDTIFDLKHVVAALDSNMLSYVRQMLFVDQNYYPESLNRLFVINAPWYFTTLFLIFKPFVDKRTLDKFLILGSDFLPTLEKYIDRKYIPSSLGGDCHDFRWTGPFLDDFGCSYDQVEEHVRKKFFDLSPEDLSRHFHTPEEREAFALVREVWDRENPREDCWKTFPDYLEKKKNQGGKGGGKGEGKGKGEGRGELNANIRINGDNNKEQGSVKSSPLASIPISRLFSFKFIGIEETRSHHKYVIQVLYRREHSWEIRRRFSDFITLHECLSNFPICRTAIHPLPSLPPKTSLFTSKKSTQVIRSRLKGLDAFLLAALRCFHSPRPYQTDPREQRKLQPASSNSSSGSERFDPTDRLASDVMLDFLEAFGERLKECDEREGQEEQENERTNKEKESSTTNGGGAEEGVREGWEDTIEIKKVEGEEGERDSGGEGDEGEGEGEDNRMPSFSRGGGSGEGLRQRRSEVDPTGIKARRYSRALSLHSPSISAVLREEGEEGSSTGLVITSTSNACLPGETAGKDKACSGDWWMGIGVKAFIAVAVLTHLYLAYYFLFLPSDPQ